MRLIVAADLGLVGSAIAGPLTQGLVESGEVFWYQLDPEVLEAK